MTPIRILLVDDSEDVRLLFRLVLESNPSFEVCGEAENGREAIALAATSCIDAIVLDLLMPVMDGLAALPVLQELCPNTPVIVVTSTATPEARRDALNRGAFAVLSKGAALEQLPRLMLDACARVGVPV